MLKFFLLGRCVDEFYIYIWKKSETKDKALKVAVPVKKDVISHDVIVEGNIATCKKNIATCDLHHSWKCIIHS